MIRRAALTVAVLAAAAPASAAPIPEGPDASSLPTFSGARAVPSPVESPAPPAHPFMAPNGRSNLHEDAYMTDVHLGPAPVGRKMERTSSFLEGVCASITFDTRDRIVTVCVGVEGPKLFLLDPKTLATLAQMNLPPRAIGPTGNLFQDFAGGGYFYLDNRDRAVIPTTSRHVFIVQAKDPPGLEKVADFDLTEVVPMGDKIISALPDWSGRIWFASVQGRVGFVEEATGKIQHMELGEQIANSFAVDETGGVYVVTDKALRRFDGLSTTWREEYENIGVQKPGQSSPGSGTTPTVMGREHVAITDNADPMNVLVYKRAPSVEGARLVCKQPVFEKGASNTDQSLIATGTSLVVENNYGYTGPSTTYGGRTTTPGIERVDLDPGGGCHKVWHSDEIAPSAVPKLGASTGLVYTYTKDKLEDPNADGWYFTAIDFRTGKTVFKRLGGEGVGFNNNYAPITIGPDGKRMYIGVLGGLVMVEDEGVAGPTAIARPKVSLHVRRRLARLRGRHVRRVRSVRFYVGRRYVARDARIPWRKRIPRRYRGRVLRAEVRMIGGGRVTLRRRVR